MKRIYLLMTLFIAFAGTALAQRSINLKVDIEEPTASQTIESAKSFNIRATVTNMGPDSLRTTDSTLWFVTLDGNPVNFTFGSQQGAYWLRFNKHVPSGDTFHIWIDNRQITYTQATDMNREICFNVLPRFNGGGADTISDGDLTNNSDCVTVLFKKSTVSVGEVLITDAGTNVASVYPNPATRTANVEVKMANKAEVSVSLMDVTGRTIVNNAPVSLEPGVHTLPIDIATVPTGLYIYQVQMGNDVSSGKLMINK